jgi:hypothetical protein
MVVGDGEQRTKERKWLATQIMFAREHNHRIYRWATKHEAELTRQIRSLKNARAELRRIVINPFA